MKLQSFAEGKWVQGQGDQVPLYGEELGGIRAVFHFMQRTALQGSPETLAAIVGGGSES